MTPQPLESRDALPASPRGLSDVILIVCSTIRGDRVRIGDLVEALGSRSLAPLLLLPCVVLVSPLSGIVGVSTLCGLSIALIATRIMAGRRSIRLPRFVLERSVDRARLETLVRRLRGPAHRVDRLFRRRLTALTRTRLGHLPGAVTVLVGLCVPLMEVVPFSATPTGVTLTMMALGLLTDDGLFVLVGMVAALAALGLALFALHGLVL